MRRHLISRESLPGDLRPQSWARRAALVTGGALALTSGGIAVAAWTTTGVGAGAATAGKDQALTAIAVPSGTLYPAAGGTTLPATVTVTNPNLFNVRVTALTHSGGLTDDKDGCEATNADVTFADLGGLAWDVPAGGTREFQVPAAVTMGAGSAAACMGATFSKSFTVTGESY